MTGKAVMGKWATYQTANFKNLKFQEWKSNYFSLILYKFEMELGIEKGLVAHPFCYLF